MGLWVLEPKSGEPVPGTVHLHEHDADGVVDHARNLKRGTGRHANLVLAPQPSDSPNDPLNWSSRRKWFTSLFLSAGCGMMAGTHNFVNPANLLLSKIFKTDISTISRSVSIILLTLGISAVVTSPLARMYGKRPVILVSNFIAMLGYIIVVAKPGNLAALYVGRAIHGLGIAALEYLVSSSVGDLFFVHERAVHLAIWHYSLSGGNALGQVFGTQILAAQGWLWPFIWTIVVIGVYTIIYFFTCPETTYHRADKFDNDIREAYSDDSSIDDKTISGNAAAPSASKGVVASNEVDVEATTRNVERKHTYRESLRVYQGRFSSESLLRALITPWSAFLLPAVSWAAFSYGCSVAFAASFSVAIGQIFTLPPYNFTGDQVGLTVLSSFVGATLGNLIPGPLSDWLVVFMSRRNGGVYEPEFRLLLSIPSLIFGLGGFWGFGLTLEARTHFMLPVFFYGMAIFAGAINSLVSNAYLLDCHRAHAQDGYAAVTITRGVYSFAMTFVINDWLARDGYRVVFFWVGALQGLSCVMGIFLYFYGKRIRLAVSKSKFIQSKLAKKVEV